MKFHIDLTSLSLSRTANPAGLKLLRLATRGSWRVYWYYLLFRRFRGLPLAPTLMRYRGIQQSYCTNETWLRFWVQTRTTYGPLGTSWGGNRPDFASENWSERSAHTHRHTVQCLCFFLVMMTNLPMHRNILITFFLTGSVPILYLDHTFLSSSCHDFVQVAAALIRNLTTMQKETWLLGSKILVG